MESSNSSRSATRLVVLFLFFLQLVSTQQPIEATWSSSVIGPDGSWQAVEVIIGTRAVVALYPGNIYASWVLTTEYCNNNRSSDGCYASVAGTYNKEQGEQLGTGSGAMISYQPDIQVFSAGLDVRGPDTVQWVDSIDAGLRVDNVSMVLADKQMFAYPNGQWYPAFAGCLGLGGNGQVNQSFALNDEETINASLIPGRLWELGEIPSNSFGLHIGSVATNTPGSLWWGGYDRNRITGDILSIDISRKSSEANFNVLLRDIAIEVVDGASPFNFAGQSQRGLLPTRDKPLSVLVNGCSPYLSLPRPICDSVTQHLPVTYDADLGLYLWDTKNPQYQQIVSSASALAFTFESSSDDSSNLTVRVPFTHLNLTLDKPLVAEPTPYFPCFTGAPDDSYVLGRAFMQDAFIGANWGAQTWWLAQAPGPNYVRRSRATAIGERDETIRGGDERWKDTWDNAWRVLSEDDMKDVHKSDINIEGDEESPGSESSPESEASPAPSQISSDDDLPTGTTVGIGVGVGVVVLGLIGTAIFFWLRRKTAQKQAQQQRTLAQSDMLHYTKQSSFQVADGRYNTAEVKAELYAGYNGRQDYHPSTTRHELE